MCFCDSKPFSAQLKRGKLGAKPKDQDQPLASSRIFQSCTEVCTKSPATCQDFSDDALHLEVGPSSESRVRVLWQDFWCRPPYMASKQLIAGLLVVFLWIFSKDFGETCS